MNSQIDLTVLSLRPVTTSTRRDVASAVLNFKFVRKTMRRTKALALNKEELSFLGVYQIGQLFKVIRRR